ncbi:MAG TPA: DNA recombination protein RmuC [Candidatus Portnoybacteria bacterium]|nr:DNA recombination protein RmuC [Candidatus Portnoybacteria bacterium]
MENLLFIGILIAVMTIGLWLILRGFNKKFEDFKESQKSDSALNIINQGMQGLQSRIDKTTEVIGQRLETVNKELGGMQEIGRQMKDLQDFLRSPKLRGNIGEQVLKDLLVQVLPRSNFDLQYQFSNGQIVDAVIKTDKGMIPIDAKFPLENFRRLAQAETEKDKNHHLKTFSRDIKKHIDDISKKYVSQEGTLDFALMYVPSEAVYYEMIRGDEPIDAYAHQKKVIFVSPNSFWYFLKVILMGLEGKKIGQASQQILGALNSIRQDSRRFGQSLKVLIGHINRAKNAMDGTSIEYGKLSSRIDNVSLLKPEEEAKKIEKGDD